MDDELFFLYKEYLEHIRLHLWFKGSDASFHKGKTSKVEADRNLYMAHFFYQKVIVKVRQMVVPK